MKTFKSLINETFLTIGFDPKHEHLRDKHRQEFHDILRNSYKNVEGGYGGLGHGTEEESKSIHKDLDSSLIKATKRDNKITSVVLYKKSAGRKGIAMGTDGTSQGKSDFKNISKEDNKLKRSWGEVSGVPEIINKKMGVPYVPAENAEKLLNKKVDITGKFTYKRKIGNDEHEKSIMGHPKID